MFLVDLFADLDVDSLNCYTSLIFSILIFSLNLLYLSVWYLNFLMSFLMSQCLSITFENASLYSGNRSLSFPYSFLSLSFIKLGLLVVTSCWFLPSNGLIGVCNEMSDCFLF